MEDDEAEKDYRATYMYWYNRMKKLRQSSEIDPEKLAELEAAFEQVRNEATKRKMKCNIAVKVPALLRGGCLAKEGYSMV